MILLLADAKPCVTQSVLSGRDQQVKSIQIDSPAVSASLDAALNQEDLELVVIECHVNENACLSLINTVKRRRTDVPVLFVTTDATDSAIAEAFKRGARDCFENPFDLRTFQEKVNNIRSFRKAPREHRLPLPLSDSGIEDASCLLSNLPDGIIRVIQFLDDHLSSRDLYLERLARVAGMSPFHFCRTFKRTIGQTPMQYVLRLRIERAKRLLKFHSQRMTVSQIATSVGFYDASNLNRHFKRLTGFTPTEFIQADVKPN